MQVSIIFFIITTTYPDYAAVRWKPKDRSVWFLNIFFDTEGKTNKKKKKQKVKIFLVNMSDLKIFATQLLTFGSSGVLQPQHILWLHRYKGAWV